MTEITKPMLAQDAIEDKIKFSWNICGKVQKTRYSKIQYEKEGRSYFKSYNLKIYLDRCMRAGH